MTHRLNCILLLLAACTAAVGCGVERGPLVEGTVTYNGAPVKDGYVTFSPTGTGTSFGARIIDGKYTTEKAYAGTFSAMIYSTGAAGAPASRLEAQQQAAAKSAPQAPDLIPENAEGNNQTVEITAGQQTLDFTLTGPQK